MFVGGVPAWAEPADYFKKGNNLYKDNNYAEALEWYHRAAEQGYLPAQLELGRIYKWGVPGSIVPKRIVGLERDYAKALEWYHKAAEQGDPSAQYNLGDMFENNLNMTNVPMDYARALKWYHKSAEQGYASAQKRLGDMYSNGRGTLEDSAIALKWYRKSAEQGMASAQENLGNMYFAGEGVRRNLVTAHMWFNLAAAHWKPNKWMGGNHGTNSAAEMRDTVGRILGTAAVMQAQHKARVCLDSNYQKCN